MVRAYLYAMDEGEPPPELEAFTMVQLFGAEAVFGQKLLSIRQMRSIVLVHRIVRAVVSRKESPNWAEWAEKNSTDNKLLMDATMASKKYLRSGNA